MNQADNQASNSAVMLSQGRLAAHFTRAEQLQIMSPEGAVLATLPNPTAGEGCSGKQALLAVLKAHRVSRVLVRNLGERMLGRLLASGLQVMQCRSARLPWPQLLASSNLLPLTQISQGHPDADEPGHHACQGGCCHGEGKSGCHQGKEEGARHACC
jgi:predicted Fe-Mo cluster-binding NifX family protein